MNNEEKVRKSSAFQNVIEEFCKEFNFETEDVESSVEIDYGSTLVHVESKENSEIYRNYLFLWDEEKNEFVANKFYY